MKGFWESDKSDRKYRICPLINRFLFDQMLRSEKRDMKRDMKRDIKRDMKIKRHFPCFNPQR
jgi:hypothetical protein